MSSEQLKNALEERGYSMADIDRRIPEIMELLMRYTPTSYDDFVKQLDIDIENILSNMESACQNHYSKKEDETTEHIIAQLKLLYPSVHHDVQNGGHCDIYVEVKDTSSKICKWLLEAKRWSDVNWVGKGLFDQLIDSYAKGGKNKNRGGLMIYCHIKSGNSYVMKQWGSHLKGLGFTPESVDDDDDTRFVTSHMLNEGNGPKFHVKHYAVNLYHAPTAKAIEKAKEDQEQKLKAKHYKEFLNQNPSSGTA